MERKSEAEFELRKLKLQLDAKRLQMESIRLRQEEKSLLRTESEDDEASSLEQASLSEQLISVGNELQELEEAYAARSNPLSPSTYIIQGKDAQKLADAYTKQFGNDKTKYPFYQEPKEASDGSRVFAFGGETVVEVERMAAKFFKEQAAQGLIFMCQEEGKGFNGVNFFSCGDKALYHGSVKEIQEQLDKALQAAEGETVKDNEKIKQIKTGLEQFNHMVNPTKRFRSVIQDGAKMSDMNTQTPPPGAGLIS